MNPLARDTDPESLAAYYERLRAMTPAQRRRRMCSLTESVRALARAGIRRRNPSASGAEVELELVRLLDGAGAVQRVKGFLGQ